MKIWGDVSKVSGAYGKQKNVNRIEKTSGVESKKDVLSISAQAKDYQSAVKIAKDVPDVRFDKIDEIQKRYESGSYDIKGRDIADKIVKSIIDKKV